MKFTRNRLFFDLFRSFSFFLFLPICRFFSLDLGLRQSLLRDSRGRFFPFVHFSVFFFPISLFGVFLISRVSFIQIIDNNNSKEAELGEIRKKEKTDHEGKRNKNRGVQKMRLPCRHLLFIFFYFSSSMDGQTDGPTF